jgi:serpin B
MKKNLFIILVTLACMASCQKNSVVEEPAIPLPEPEEIVPEATDNIRRDIPLTKSEQAIVQGNNTFAFRLLRTVIQNEEENKNILVSPLSASLALAMLNNGAARTTRNEIQTALGYGDCTQDDMNGYFQKMIAAMQTADTCVTFESANSIWIREDFPVLAPFTETNQHYYGAQIRNVAFNPETADLINSWCAEKTHGNIKKILEQISPDAVMYLLNALYFKGSWRHSFNREWTEDAPFYNQDGTTVSVPAMFQAYRYPNYAKTDAYEIAELPYGNEAFSMVLILPAPGVAPASILEEMDADAWENTRTQMRQTAVNLWLPRFKVAYDRELNDDLKALGMQSMFNYETADFTLIHPTEPLYVTKVGQKTTLSVDEEGSEASAVTVIEMAVGSIPGDGSPPVNLKINRPFIYLIKEQSTGSISFIGVTKNL